MPIKIIEESWEMFWNAEEIRFLVLVSLCLQFGLVFLSPSRKRTARKPLIFLLWSFYQAADYFATFSLGHILKRQNQEGRGDLTAFWAPFLLLHLGGPDTITSYSIEDNELWLRHLNILAVQTATAFMVVLGLVAIPKLCVAAGFVFLIGCVKYAERILALRSASMNQLRDSLVKDPDPGPNYADFMQEYIWRREAGQSGYVKKKNEPMQPLLPSNHEDSGNINLKLVVEAYESFKRFKPIVVDLMLTFQERKISQNYFWYSEVSHAFKVVEMELSFLYDVFHTKAINIHGIRGVIWRFFSLVIISVAFYIFHNCEKQGYVNVDIVISYILLGSAVFMELTSLLLLITSDWMIVALTRHPWLNKLVVALTRHPWLNKLVGVITCAVSCIFSKGKPRWSNTMSQYNLLTLSLGDKKSLITRIFSAIKVKELWDNFIFIFSIGVPCKLKALLFEDLVKRSKSARNTADFKELRYCKGEKSLKEEGCSHLTWTIDKEFDESILLWHIATDLCFHIYGNDNENCETGPGVVKQNHVDKNGNCEICEGHVEHINGDANENRETSQGVVEHIKSLLNFSGRNNHISYSDSENSLIISNYMVYLLIMQPSMMPAGIGKIRFKDTCAEAKVFFRAQKGLTEAEAREALLDVETVVDPIQVKGDRCKSVLFDACRLAKELNLLPEDERWCLISRVWVEMLGYAAINCNTNYHAKQLSQGGELLTHVWLLMAHMGIGEQYRVETGHATAKLAFNN